ncbi:MAG: hypothetical protein AAFO29_23815, partial [Actinomycetota bacterium]
MNATVRGSAAKAALPALIIGALGLTAGVLALVLELPWLGLAAGALALVCGLVSVGLARRLDEQGAFQRLVEDELRTVRLEAKSTEEQLKGQVESLSAEIETGFEEPELDEDDLEDGPTGGLELLLDPGTGLFSEQFFAVTLDTRIAAARRHLRPVALVLLDVVTGMP